MKRFSFVLLPLLVLVGLLMGCNKGFSTLTEVERANLFSSEISAPVEQVQDALVLALTETGYTPDFQSQGIVRAGRMTSNSRGRTSVTFSTLALEGGTSLHLAEFLPEVWDSDNSRWRRKRFLGNDVEEAKFLFDQIIAKIESTLHPAVTSSTSS